MGDREMIDTVELGMQWRLMGIKAKDLKLSDAAGMYYVVAMHSPRRGVLEEIRAVFRSRHQRDAFFERVVGVLGS